jgi:hypothetical protein
MWAGCSQARGGIGFQPMILRLEAAATIPRGEGTPPTFKPQQKTAILEFKPL